MALFGTKNNATELNVTNEIAFGAAAAPSAKCGAAAKHKNLKNLEFPKKHLEILEFLQTRIPTKNSRIPYKKFRIHKKILEFQQKILKNSKIP
ncbi:MAG: hypothetical protein SOU37_02790 [Campylobacter lanienae]|nr:hypothetical protein [Campylobacteraceae bacterium]MDY2817527.1 hypothetical protein [Campylobacter lanienae]